MASTKLAAAAAVKTAAQKSGAEPTGNQLQTAKAAVGEVVAKTNKETALAVAGGGIDFEADAGMGMEGADKDSFALPFLAVLQGLSPQLETVEGAKPGLIINTVTNELFKTLRFVPCAFQRRYNRWLPRSAGGGFKGTLTVAEVETLMASGEAREVKTKNDAGQERTALMYEDTELKDTRNHFVLVVDEDGNWTPALISCASTQIKKSKRLMALIQGVIETSTSGKKFNPPSFARLYEASVVDDSNASGKWKSFEFSSAGVVADPEMYQAAKEFHAQVSTGIVVAAPPPSEAEPAEGEGDTGGRF